MYLRKVTLKNIRAFEEFTWEVAPGEEPGWHVLLGENGCGKSTVLKATALALIPSDSHSGLFEQWDRWIRRGSVDGGEQVYVALDLIRDPDYDDLASPPTKGPEPTAASGRLELTGGSPKVQGNDAFQRGIQAGAGGWLSASFGPLRRFTGGDPDEERIHASLPRLAPHLTIFNERYALSEAMRWLLHLDYRRRSEKSDGRLVPALIEFLNGSGALPHGARIDEVDADGVWCVDAAGTRLRLGELSDGYRSLLSLTFELLRQFARCYGSDRVFQGADPCVIDLPGLVLIDEVDVHLHPTWQHRIGEWFTRVFPNVQFLVTTHSPIVCQSARTIWHLPIPGSDVPATRVTGAEFDRLRYGSILDAFGTGLFGDGVTRSEAGKQQLQRLAELNLKDLQHSLTSDEEQERREIQRITPTAASGRDFLRKVAT